MSDISRKSFLAELRNLLSFMEPADRELALKRYERMLDRVGPEGEDALIASLGSPVRLVISIEKEMREAKSQGKTPFLDEEQPPKVAEPVRENADGVSFARAAAEVLEEPESEPAEPAIEELDEEFPIERLLESEERAAVQTEFPEVVFGLPEEESEPAAEQTEEIAPAGEFTAFDEIVFAEKAEVTEEIDLAEEAFEEIAPAEKIAESAPEAVPERAPARASGRAKPAPEPDEGPGGLRIAAAVLVTIPFIVMWVVTFALAIALGALVAAIGVSLGAMGVYLGGYVFNGAIGFMPDTFFVAGCALSLMAFSLLLVWTGISGAVGSIAFSIRRSARVYAKILKKKPARGGKYHG